MTYKVAIGHNNTAGLTDITPQPRTPRLLPGEVIYAASGLVYEDGAYTTRLLYNALSWSAYTALLAQFGLTSAKSAAVTLRLRKDTDNTFANYNAILVRPTFEDGAVAMRRKLRDVRFDVLRIEAV